MQVIQVKEIDRVPRYIENRAINSFENCDMGFKHSCIIARQGVILTVSNNSKSGKDSIHAEVAAIGSLKGKGA